MLLMYVWKLCLGVLKTIILAMATYAIYIYKMKSLTAITI